MKPSATWCARDLGDGGAAHGAEPAERFSAPAGISLHRQEQLERDDAAGVTFRYRANDDTVQRATVSGLEFVRRVLQHVLPKGFQRVRHYGWRGAAATAKWQRILALLDWRPAARVPPAPLPPPPCPACGKTMFLIGTLPRAPTEWQVAVKR